MAPEQFSENPYNPFTAEIYSLGMFLFHLVFKTFPFETDAGSDSAARDASFLYNFEHSSRNIYNVKPSKALMDVLAMMMAYNPHQRASFDQIMASRWFKGQHH